MTPEVQTPDWVKDAIFYQIFPDRFAKSDRVKKPNNLEPWDQPPTVYGFKGGDLMGVVEHLDYLQDLGINAIYFNPIFQSASNHRYHTHDYLKIDPILGGEDAFRILLDEAHRRRIRIVLDGVFNHASRGFFQFNHVLETGSSSPYIDWFNIEEFPLNAYQGEPNYDCWADLPALPKFNIDNPDVREFIFNIARYWVEKGIDGWRLDVPYEIKDAQFWREFRRAVKDINPDAYIVGEVAWEAQEWLQGDQFDAVMNYLFMQACLSFFGGEKINREIELNLMGLPTAQVLNAVNFARRLQELLSIYPREIVYAQLNLLSSHDMPRFVSLVNGDKSSLRLATLLQMTFPGAPCIYYGDEIGMSGGQSGFPEASRWAFPWDEGRWDQDLRQDFKTFIAIRNDQPALRRGEYTHMDAQDGVLAFVRWMDRDVLAVIINNRETSYEVDLPITQHFQEGSRWKDLLSDREAAVANGRLTDMLLPPKSGAVLTAYKDTIDAYTPHSVFPTEEEIWESE